MMWVYSALSVGTDTPGVHRHMSLAIPVQNRQAISVFTSPLPVSWSLIKDHHQRAPISATQAYSSTSIHKGIGENWLLFSVQGYHMFVGYILPGANKNISLICKALGGMVPRPKLEAWY